MRVPPLGLLLGASALLHLAGFGGAALWLGISDTATAEKASIRIALGSSGARAGAVTQPETVEAPEDVPEPQPRPEPEPVPEPVQQSEPVQSPPREPVVPVEAQPLPQPARQPEPAIPEPRPQTQPSQPEGEQGQSGTGSNQETDTEGATSDAGYQAVLASHDALVLGHLSRFKRFPPRARMRGEEGEVGVEFEIARDGRLIAFRIVSSSGSRNLDAAALAQMEAATPYPAAPDKALWATRTYRTKMRYSLRQ